MEELNLIDLLKYYLKNLPVILITCLIALIIGYIYVSEFQTPMYHGTTTILLVENKAEKLTQNELTINEQLVSTYSEIIKSRRVLEQVIDSLDLETTPASLANKITVTSVSDTPIIKITVSYKNKNKAVIITNKIAEVFKQEVAQIYKLENISIIDEAIPENNPYNINIPKQITIYVLIGLILSCTIIFIIYYFDNTIKNKNEIESKLGLPVLSEIPLATKLEILEKRRKKENRKQSRHKQPTNIESDLSFELVDKISIPQKKATTTKKTTTTSKKTTKKATTKKEGGK